MCACDALLSASFFFLFSFSFLQHAGCSSQDRVGMAGGCVVTFVKQFLLYSFSRQQGVTKMWLLVRLARPVELLVFLLLDKGV